MSPRPVPGSTNQRPTHRYCTLIDELADVDRSFSAILNGITIDTAEREKINRSIQAMTSFGSPLERTMTVSAQLISPDDQIKLWNSAKAIARSWTEYTAANPSSFEKTENESCFLKFSENINDIQKIAHILNNALTVQNKSRTEGVVDHLKKASMLLIAIFIGGVVITASASLLMFVVMRITRKAEQDILAREAMLSQQNLQFKAALDNMRHGLTMFDALGRLEIYNSRVLDIYGLPPGSITSGMTSDDVTTIRLKCGHVIKSESGEELEQHFDEHHSSFADEDKGPSLWDEDERNVVVNGRTIRITRSSARRRRLRRHARRHYRAAPGADQPRGA